MEAFTERTAAARRHKNLRRQRFAELPVAIDHVVRPGGRDSRLSRPESSPVFMHYFIYFAAPVLLGLLGVKLLGQRPRVFVAGMAAFGAAWVIDQTIASVSLRWFHLTERSFAYAVIVSVAAGVVEETVRYIAFRRLAAFRNNGNWRSALGFAMGHHGMETIIVGLTVLLVALVVTYKPEAISDPQLLKQCQAAVAQGNGVKLYSAFERLLVGLLIHTCFSGLVMLAVTRSVPGWLSLAVAWHFAHDMVGLNLHRLPAPRLAGRIWIGIIVIVYTTLAVRIFRALYRTEAMSGHSTAQPGGSLILPGRPA